MAGAAHHPRWVRRAGQRRVTAPSGTRAVPVQGPYAVSRCTPIVRVPVGLYRIARWPRSRTITGSSAHPLTTLFLRSTMLSGRPIATRQDGPTGKVSKHSTTDICAFVSSRSTDKSNGTRTPYFYCRCLSACNSVLRSPPVPRCFVEPHARVPSFVLLRETLSSPTQTKPPTAFTCTVSRPSLPGYFTVDRLAVWKPISSSRSNPPLSVRVQWVLTRKRSEPFPAYTGPLRFSNLRVARENQLSRDRHGPAYLRIDPPSCRGGTRFRPSLITIRGKASGAGLTAYSST